MSHANGKDSVSFLSEKENHPLKREKTKSVPYEFVQAVSRVAVAQICESVGFQGFQQSALEILTDIGIRYLGEVGKAARSCANSANRSQCNVFDVIQGLEDLGSIQGFSSASNVGHSLSQSGVVRDMIRYVCQAEEIPFAYPVPSFPVVKKRKLDPSFAQAKENPPDEHIPIWLPRFPDSKAHERLTPWKEKRSDAEPPNKTELRKLLCNGSKAEEADTGKMQRAVDNNPFLALPIPFEEKAVLLPVIPAKLLDEDVGYHQSCEVTESPHLNLEPSSQTNGTETGSIESDDRQNVFRNGRLGVHFKLGNAKKPIEGIEKNSLWFGDDQDGIDENERNPEKILLENSPEASPL